MDELTEVEFLRALNDKLKEENSLLKDVIWLLSPYISNRGQEILAHLFKDRKPADAIPYGSEVQERGVGQQRGTV